MKKKPHVKTSRRTLAQRAVFLIIVFLLAGSIAFPAPANWVIARMNQLTGTELANIHMPLSLGLDLQGGTRLEYVADLSQIPEAEKADAMEGVRDVIERRVNALGVSEPLVQTIQAGREWRLVVELAGIRDVREAIRVIGETPTLDFREPNPEAQPDRALTDEEYAQIETENAEKLVNATNQLARVEAGEAFEDIARAESDIASADGGDLGFISGTGEYLGLHQRLSEADTGLYGEVIDDGATLYVAEVLETRPAGQEVRASHLLIQWDGSAASGEARTKEEALARIQEAQSALETRPWEDVVQEYSDEPEAQETFGDLGWFPRGIMVPEFEEAVFPLEEGGISGVVETGFGYHLIQKTGEREGKEVHARVIATEKTRPSDIVSSDPWLRTDLTGKQLRRSTLDFDPNTGQPQVTLQFDDQGSELFAALTKKNIGQQIGIFLDDEVISAPVVNQEIIGGQAVISGSFTLDEAKLLAQRLQAGALPVPIENIAQQTVGPTLGAESVNASLQAALIGFLLVMIFMILVYRIPGIVSVLALVFYAAIVFALFKLIPVTLTLSGIAGFILSVGIAVDANVLIFERLKEELKDGKSIGPAMNDAFNRAWLSIRDGNATTLIACAVLYWFSSSVIKGFALTLAIGVLVSMLSAIVVTRLLLRLVAQPRFVSAVPWLFLQKKKKKEDA